MPSYFPASAEIDFREALSELVFFFFFAQSQILRDPKIDTKRLFQISARESNMYRKSFNKVKQCGM